MGQRRHELLHPRHVVDPRHDGGRISERTTEELSS